MNPFRPLWAVLLWIAPAGALPGQQQELPSDPARRARTLVTWLELDARRATAADELLRLGAAAVPAIARALNDPRPEVVQRLCQILCALGPDAAAALPVVETMRGSPDAGIARMAAMTALALHATGATTVCEYEQGRVVRIERDGSERVLLECDQPWDAEPLPDGHLLVTHYLKNRVAEYDETGKEVWKFDNLKMPLEADRLLDGRTLIADTQGARVIEVDAKGAIVWEFPVPGPNRNPYDVERLANGNTLVALYPDKVVEVDREGKVVWEVGQLEGVFDADRLPNGNTLLTLFGADLVREVDRQGATVWESKKLAGPNDADRLPDGNTLVAAANRFVEIARDGTVVAERVRGKRVAEVVRH